MKTDAIALDVPRSRVGDFIALTKPRLNSLVVVTAGVGYYLGVTAGFHVATLLHTLVGSALVAAGAAALNQVAERDLDEQMVRTRSRPLPGGRLQPFEAGLFAIVVSAIGIGQLALGANPLAAVVSLATLVSYVFLYTPLKRLTPWATLIGAVPGALPPVIGWAAAQGQLTAGAWTLFGIVFFWQLPHFHALAWLYRDDFRRAHLPLVAVLDETGRRTALHALVYAALLLPASLLPGLVGLADGFYTPVAAGLGVWFLVLAIRFALDPSGHRARSLFMGSLVYLPALWALLIADRVI